MAGDDDLLEQAAEDQQRAPSKVDVLRVRRPRELIEEFGGPHDRSRDEVREEADVEEQIHERAGGSNLLPVDVDDVRDAVEGQEGDSHRHGEAGRAELHLHAERPCQRLELGRDEIVVLEEAQRHEVADDGEAG